MTNIEIAKVIKERFTRVLSLNKFKQIMELKYFYKSLESTYPLIIKDIKTDCNLADLIIDYNLKVIKAITADNKEYLYKFSIEENEFRIFAKRIKD